MRAYDGRLRHFRRAIGTAHMIRLLDRQGDDEAALPAFIIPDADADRVIAGRRSRRCEINTIRTNGRLDAAGEIHGGILEIGDLDTARIDLGATARLKGHLQRKRALSYALR